MAAHSPTVPVAASVMPYQPPSGWDAWLREMAAAINLIVFKLEDIQGRLDASVPPPGPGEEDGIFTLVCTGQSNAFGVGESDGSAAPGGDLYINQDGGGIKVWNGSAWEVAVYGNDPLPTNGVGPADNPSSNIGIAYLNARRAAGIDPMDTEYRLILSAEGGVSISNFVSLKLLGGNVVGQFMVNYIQEAIIESNTARIDAILYSQGESDRAFVSGNSSVDTYTGGLVDTTNQFGTNDNGLLPGQVNPVYNWFSCDADMVATVVANNGFGYGNSYETAFRVLVRMFRALRTAGGEPAVSGTTPIIVNELGMTVYGIDYQRNDFFWALSHGADWDANVFVNPTAGLPLSRVVDGATGKFSNLNHWTSASLNIIGQRAFQTHISKSRSGVKDSQGRATAPRTYMEITNNVDQYGETNSTDGTYYLLSPDLVRNGTSVVSTNSSLIFPASFYQKDLGAVDIEIYVPNVAGGTTRVAPSIHLNDANPISGLADNVGPVTFGGEVYNIVYDLATVGMYRFTSTAGATWRLTSAQQILAGGGVITAGGEIGVRTTNPNALFELAGEHAADGQALLVTTTLTGDLASMFGAVISPQFQPVDDTIATAYGIRVLPSLLGVTANLTEVAGVWARFGFGTGYVGTVTKGASFWAAMPNIPGSVAATVTDYAYFYAAPNTGMADNKVGTLHGLYIDTLDQSLTTSNIAYAIRQVGQGSHSYFDARLGMGVAAPLSQVQIGGDRTLGAWTTLGRQLALDAATLTDGDASGATVSLRAASFSIASSTLAAATPKTITNAATAYIAGPPVAGSGVTITNPYALYIGAGDVYIAGTGEMRASVLRTSFVAVSSLPAVGQRGRRGMVVDATATTFGTVVAGGGANVVPVYDDGTNWRIG